MAVRINQYQQQTAPSSLGVVPRASGVAPDTQVADAGRRLAASAGYAIDTYANVQAKIEEERKRQEAEDAKVYADSALADAQLKQLSKFAEMQDSAEAGAPHFTKQYNDQFSEYEETLLSVAPTDSAKKFLRDGLTRLRVDMTGRAIQYETDERRKWRVDTGKKAITDRAGAMAVDPSRFDVTLAEQHAMIDAYDIPQEAKRALHEFADETIATSAVLGEAERDPEMALAKIAERLGLDAADVMGPKAGPSRNGAEVQAKYEAISAGFGFKTTSTTRSAEENAAVGGVPDSQHLEGKATARDWSIKGKSPGEISAFVAALRDEGFEASVHTKGTAPHIHAELPPERARKTPAQAVAEKPEGEPINERAYDILGTPKLVSLLGSINSKLDQEKSQYRSLISARETDDLAAYGDGKAATNPITAGEFIKAYGGVEGARRFAAYKSAQGYASEMSGFKTATPEQIVATVKAKEPQPGEGYAVAAQQHNVAVQAANAVLTQRAEDPQQFAMDNGLSAGQPLNFQDAEEMGAGLSARMGVADTMATKYGTRYTLLTKGEATQMSAMLGGMTAPEKAAFVKQIRTSLPDDRAYQSIMGQIRQDSPVTAMAGSIMTQTSPVMVKPGGWASRAEVIQADRVGMMILAGEDILNPAKGIKGADGKGGTFPMPSDGEMRDAWMAEVGDAYRGDPATASASYQAFRAFYAAAAHQAGKGDGELDGEIADLAARSVSGGVTEHNGRSVVMPWGMGEDAFIDALRLQYEAQARAAGVTVDFDAVEFLTTGNGVYRPSLGMTPLQFEVRVEPGVSRSGRIGGAR